MRLNENRKKTRNNFLFVLNIVLGIMVIVTAVFLVYTFQEKRRLEAQMAAAAEETVSESIEIYLPENFYAAAGLPLEIYNSQVTSLGKDITKYNVLWSCEVGENLERKYSLDATEEMMGDYELTFSVYDNALNLLAEESSTLKIVHGGPPEKISVLQIGDPLPDEAVLYQRLQELSGGKIVFDKTVSPEEIPGENIQADAVQIYFEGSHVQDAGNNAEVIKKLVDDIRSADAEVPICVANVVCSKEYNQEMLEVSKDLLQKLSEYEGIYLIPADACVDSVYNYEAVSQTEDSMKPNTGGYYQLADLLYGAYCKIME